MLTPGTMKGSICFDYLTYKQKVVRKGILVFWDGFSLGFFAGIEPIQKIDGLGHLFYSQIGPILHDP